MSEADAPLDHAAVAAVLSDIAEALDDLEDNVRVRWYQLRVRAWVMALVPA